MQSVLTAKIIATASSTEIFGHSCATNFLLSQPLADHDRLMAMGGSLGGFYSWLLAGLDDRFKHIFPTFGCGFLDTEARQVWESDFASMDPKKAEIWLRAFDPGRTRPSDSSFHFLPAGHE